MYRTTLMGVILFALAAAPAAMAAPHVEKFHADFSGFNEIGALNAASGAVLSPGHGTLELRLDRVNQTLSFVLTYSDLSASVTQSHIHFGKKHVAGGVMVFFCSNLSSAPAGTQPCPAGGGTVTGTLSAANVLPIAGQNVPAGDFQAVIDALESDTAYANIHTVNFPAGEIRGEIRRGSEGHDD
jgi:CHRD domain